MTIKILALSVNVLSFMVVLFCVWKLHGMGGFFLNMRNPQSADAKQWSNAFHAAIIVSIIAGAFFHLG